ncbi:hypothetical protein PtA15_4A401 [Puccinia triticina]|nr:uncharacterized protein PtA15_4A401 [Puccinia triticina]WAQ83950.1 hypothetical protein PtA15_4A401 [Puccinia triticina]
MQTTFAALGTCARLARPDLRPTQFGSSHPPSRTAGNQTTASSTNWNRRRSLRASEAKDAQKMNTPTSAKPQQLSRKNNDSHSRKLQSLHYQNFFPNTTTPTKNPTTPSRKRSVSTFKIDRSLVLPTSHNLLNQPSKKLKPASPSTLHHPHQYHIHTTALKAVQKNPLPSPANQKKALLNVTNLNSLKLVERKNEKPQKEVPLKSLLPELRPRPEEVDARPSHPSPRHKPVPIAQAVRVAGGSTKPSTPINSYKITTPLKVRAPKAAEGMRRTFDLGPAGLELIRPSKPPVPTRLICPLVASHSFTPISFPKPPSPMVSPSKKRNRAPGELLARARRLIETDQSSLRMWQSDLDAGALRPGKTRKFKVLKVHKDRGSQIAYCMEINQAIAHTSNKNPLPNDNASCPKIFKIFLRGPDCKVNDRLKIFSPWTEIQPNIIISNKFISS